jgi:Ca-activated chloride channel family protein
MFKKDSHRPQYVLFLTDGNPTVKERDEGALLKIAKKANDTDARLFAFGIGYDVNVRLLDNLVGGNRGASEYIKEKEPMEAKVSALYNKIKRPVMTDVKVKFGDVKVSMTYPREMPDLFDGGQIVLVGRYDKGGDTKLTITGCMEDKTQTFEYKVAFDDASDSNRNKFVERLWAMRRIGYLLDQIQLSGESKEVVEELVKLSKEYGIMTPYTAFLADESVSMAKPEELYRHGAEYSLKLSSAAGASGGDGQMAAKNRQAMNDATRASASGGPAAAPGSDITGNTALTKYEAGEQERVTTVQNVGNQALYRRGQVWMTTETAKLDPVKDADQIKEITRFSDEYFELTAKNSVDENRVLASQREGEELLVNFRGQAYRIR